MRFREWVKLNESVDVGVSMTQDQWRELHARRVPEDLLSLTNELMRAVHPIVPMGYEQISPDGDDHFNLEGIVNLYMNRPNSEIPPDMIRPILTKIKEYVEKVGGTMGEPREESYADALTRDLRKWPESDEDIKREYLGASGGQLDKTRVIRIPIKLDPQAIEKADMPPDVNMGFPTAKALFEDLFDLPSAGPDPVQGVVSQLAGEEPPEEEGEWRGYNFKASDYIRAYDRMGGDIYNWATMYTKEPQGPDPESEGPRIYQGGLDAGRIVRAAKAVYELAKWAVDHGFDEMFAG